MKKFLSWLKRNKNSNSNKEKTEMTLDELKAKYAELSEEDKKAFLESVNGGAPEDTGEPTPVDETPTPVKTKDETPVPTSDETPTPTPVDETPTSTRDEDLTARIDSLEQSNKELLGEVKGLKAAIEGLKKDPQPADKDTTTNLDKLTSKYSN